MNLFMPGAPVRDNPPVPRRHANLLRRRANLPPRSGIDRDALLQPRCAVSLFPLSGTAIGCSPLGGDALTQPINASASACICGASKA